MLYSMNITKQTIILIQQFSSPFVLFSLAFLSASSYIFLTLAFNGTPFFLSSSCIL